ncbi:MAG: HAMP domain-containing histidine kinase [Oscillospiraceae bacterium]|nr:HAMP domain-containing histidine kinase [Oscillospiraceae bacterium]
MDGAQEREKRHGRRFSIRRQWMGTILSTTAVILVVAVSAFSVAMVSYYYTSVSTGLENTVSSAVDFLSNYTKSGYSSAVTSYVSNFEYKDCLELQFLSRYGSVQQSTSGLTAGVYPGTADITEAMSSGQISTWVGRSPDTGEAIMAVSAPVVYGGSTVGIMRVVTSLRLVNRQAVATVAAAVGIAAGILGIICVLNLYFVRSIVGPVVKITETAKRIAGGSYGIQMEKEQDNEIGDLTDAINDMSIKVMQSEKAQMEFVSSVSHELRTPLTAITGWAETIMNGEVQNAGDVKKGMNIIASEARRLTSMVEELLEFSRIADGRFTLSVETMNLKAEVEDAVYTYREFFRREGVALNYDDQAPDELLPPISGDPHRLRQVFCNLLDNAFKYGGSGKRVDVTLRLEEDEAVVTIRDFGPGIPEEELPHVKYKFYKGSSKARGSGIGLAVCDEIAVRHGGTLGISNAEGGGCAATLRLPIHITATASD